MALQVDAVTRTQMTRIIFRLRDVRLKARLSQNTLAENLPFRGRAISEWETLVVEPILEHLILLAYELDHRLVVINQNGEEVINNQIQRPGEDWVVFQRRRLATPLRNRRIALGWNQGKLGGLVGVSRDSVQRWELVRVPPRPIAHAVWARQLGYRLDVHPFVNAPPSRLHRPLHFGLDELRKRPAPVIQR